MICYLNTIFCTYHEECNNRSNCSIALTEQVIEKARNWQKSLKDFKSDYPISIAIYVDKPPCFESKTVK